MKTYSTKSNAKRAAVKQGLVDYSINPVDGGFVIQEAQPVETTPVVEEVQEEVVFNGYTHCPHCNIHLSNGYNTDPNTKDGIYYCLACNGALNEGNQNKSAIDNPVKTVWDIADKLWGSKRKDIIAACVEAGVAYNTARTQYQAFYKVKKATEK